MELLDRYLAAIGRELPKRQAPDITAELRDTLLSRIEEKEEALGRPLSPAEVKALLIEFGHPLVVASRYRKTQHLIGPELYPFWWATLRVVFAIAGATWIGLLVLGLGGAGGHGPHMLAHATPGLWTGGVFLFGVVTLTFVVLERVGGTRFVRRWNPAQLPPANARGRRSRFELMTEIVANGIFLLWWAGLIRFRHAFPFPGGMQVDLAPVWMSLYWPIVAYCVADIAVSAIELLRPSWQRANAVLGLGKNAAGCAILIYALRAGHWVVVTAPAFPPAIQARTQAGFDSGMQLGLVATAFIFGAKAVYDIWRLARAGGGFARRGGVNGGRLAV